MPITRLTLEPKSDTSRKDEILGYNIDFDQSMNSRTGKPTGSPILTSMTVRIARESEEDVPYYLKWQLEPGQTEDLDICFYDHLQLKRTIKIENAYLVSYNQDCNEPGRIEETLIISPQKLTMEGEVYDPTEI